MVNYRLVESELSHHFWCKCYGFKFDDNKPSQFQVVEQHVNIVIMSTHFQMHLSSNERKTLSQFEQEFRNMPSETFLYILFSTVCIRSGKIKQVWIFKHKTNHIGLVFRQGFIKIGR